MPSRSLVPRIRIDLLDSSPCKLPLWSLSPSSTFDIKDILGSANLLPKLLAEDFAFDNADDELYFENGRLQNFPSFPVGRQPPLFILISHRARLPFSTRQDAFDPGDFFRDEEDVRPLLTAPTVPRMTKMMKEQLYVQKWVDALTPYSPPKHIPWTCEKPAANWASETEQRGAVQEPSFATGTKCLPSPGDKVPHSQELYSLTPSKSPGSILASTGSHTSTVRPKSADVDPDTLRGQSRTSHTAHRITRTSQTHSSSTLLPSGSGTTPSMSDAPLAARRGKSLNGLKLKERVIEHLEYPDIPTPFRGSPVVWSPRFDAFPVQPFTDHESMLWDLRSKCAALGSGAPDYIQGLQHSRTVPIHTPLNVDEWAFTRGLATFDSNISGLMGSQISKGITADISVFPPEDSSTPVKGFATPLGLVPCINSTPTLQSPKGLSSDPPGLPLPPRPALINPSTPPHVRGILKKVKSVRFEDMITKGPENCTLPVSRSSVHLSPLRPCTPKPNTTKSSNGPAPVKEAPGRSVQKKSAPRTRLPPKRAKAKENLDPLPLKVGNAPESTKPTLVITSTSTPSRIAHAKETTSLGAFPRAQANQRGSSVIEADVRKGTEGTTKGRLSTPLRNIFRFR